VSVLSRGLLAGCEHLAARRAQVVVNRCVSADISEVLGLGGALRAWFPRMRVVQHVGTSAVILATPTFNCCSI
jgi:hypothetical protein